MLKDSIDLLDINKKKGFPRTYRFNGFIRWFTIILSFLVICYAIWFILTAIDAQTGTFKKIVPFIIIFLAGNSLFRNLYSLNYIDFHEDKIIFGYLLAKKVVIRWEKITKMSVYSGKAKAVVLEYNIDGQKKQLIFTMGFPHMLEILNSIAEQCPGIEYDSFMQNIIIQAYHSRHENRSEDKTDIS